MNAVRWLSLATSSFLLACGASEVQSQRLKDGSWQFNCELAMDECVRRAQDRCFNRRFRILEGVSETRLRDVPPFEQAYHTSRLRLACTHDGADPLISVGKTGGPPLQSVSRLCGPGETRACVGAGACKGGQVCLPDGSGFGNCDCGSTVPDPAPRPNPTAPTVPDPAQGPAPL